MREFIDTRDLDGFDHLLDNGGLIWGEHGINSQPAYVFLNDNGAVDRRGALTPEQIKSGLAQLVAQ